jgi:ElaB/YqjD/DUF883 family membrane-anchored ribosome-binding protein
VHEVKGKSESGLERRLTTRIWKHQETPKKMSAKFRNGSAMPKKQSGNNGHRNTSSPNTKEKVMSQSVLERTAEQVADSARQASRASSAVADAIEDGVGVVRRAAKQGGDAAEEFLNDTTQRIQRHPVLTVAATFAVGLAAGTVIGWTMKRR